VASSAGHLTVCWMGLPWATTAAAAAARHCWDPAAVCAAICRGRLHRRRAAGSPGCAAAPTAPRRWALCGSFASWHKGSWRCDAL
jgi:hypothetical protein